jgi:hypothetical protein
MLNMARWIRPAVFNVLSISFLGITAYLVIADEHWSATGRGGIAFGAAALCVLIGNLDNIESLKGHLKSGKLR